MHKPHLLAGESNISDTLVVKGDTLIITEQQVRAEAFIGFRHFALDTKEINSFLDKRGLTPLLNSDFDLTRAKDYGFHIASDGLELRCSFTNSDIFQSRNDSANSNFSSSSISIDAPFTFYGTKYFRFYGSIGMSIALLDFNYSEFLGLRLSGNEDSPFGTIVNQDRIRAFEFDREILSILMGLNFDTRIPFIQADDSEYDLIVGFGLNYNIQVLETYWRTAGLAGPQDSKTDVNGFEFGLKVGVSKLQRINMVEKLKE